MATLTYPKSVRLHHRKAFQALLDKGSTLYNAVFKVYWFAREAEAADGPDAGGCRFAVSVPKRTFKRAVIGPSFSPLYTPKTPPILS